MKNRDWLSSSAQGAIAQLDFGAIALPDFGRMNIGLPQLRLLWLKHPPSI
ncbi:MAG TPA: hypothetical protein V6D14_30060 [Coleofasciculaceae cyanobacterium]